MNIRVKFYLFIEKNLILKKQYEKNIKKNKKIKIINRNKYLFQINSKFDNIQINCSQNLKLKKILNN